VYRKQGWNALFMGNHDQPRPVSRYGSDHHRYHTQTMLTLAFYGQRGTPFIYQGEEIGMINYPFQTIKDFKDVESINYYHDQLGKQSKQSILTSLKAKGRDNARTPMQWDDSLNAGFSTGQPWLPVHPKFNTINVKTDSNAKHSIQAFLKMFLSLRKKHQVFLDGELTFHSIHPNIYAYERANKEERILILTSFADHAITITLKDHHLWQLLLTNHPSLTLKEKITLPPFFAGLYLRKKNDGND
jgi:glycosidase